MATCDICGEKMAPVMRRIYFGTGGTHLETVEHGLRNADGSQHVHRTSLAPVLHACPKGHERHFDVYTACECGWVSGDSHR